MNSADTNQVTVLGIRHHGPGSARAVQAALDELQPALVLIEGPDELAPLVGLLQSPECRPPVAGLVYVPDQPQHCSFFPLAVFSPEWVALQWCGAHGIGLEFIDLPGRHYLALSRAQAEADAVPHSRPVDPIEQLAAAGGYDDPERWWEDVIEHRHHGLDVFVGITNSMGSVREDAPIDVDTARREAWMRRCIRRAMKDTTGPIAIVCGAWHAPVLDPDTFPTKKSDDELLRGLAKVKTSATWVAWTSQRLALGSGYGAGVMSPGWYHHLFTHPVDATAAWFVRTGMALRREGLETSSASLIDAVRLSSGLAAVRGRPSAGLEEVLEATQAVLCAGSVVPLQLIQQELVIGTELGAVPDDAPRVPLAQDLAAQQRSLRLKPAAGTKSVELDLRTDYGLARSHLLWRLRLLGVDWGEPEDTRGRGTFKESWSLAWRPELDVAVVVAAPMGTTVVAAANAMVRSSLAEKDDLAQATGLVETCLLADLGEALADVLVALASRAAHQHHVTALMEAMGPLARSRRYGDVRRVDTARIDGVVREIGCGSASG